YSGLFNLKKDLVVLLTGLTRPGHTKEYSLEHLLKFFCRVQACIEEVTEIKKKNAEEKEKLKNQPVSFNFSLVSGFLSHTTPSILPDAITVPIETAHANFSKIAETEVKEAAQLSDLEKISKNQ